MDTLGWFTPLLSLLIITVLVLFRKRLIGALLKESV